jgi:hypothetical protein
MSRAQDRSSGLQPGAQGAERATGATGTGTSTGAVATGSTTGTTSGQTTTTTTTTSGMRERSGSQMPSESYTRGTEPTTAYRPAYEGQERGSGVMGGSLSVVAGLLTFLAGLGFVVRPHFYPTAAGYAYQWTGRGWGWVLLGLGIALFAVGACALLGMAWARPVGVAIAVLTAIAGFLFLVYSPVWGIVLVALSVFAIWGLLHDGAERRMSV